MRSGKRSWSPSSPPPSESVSSQSGGRSCCPEGRGKSVPRIVNREKHRAYGVRYLLVVPLKYKGGEGEACCSTALHGDRTLSPPRAADTGTRARANFLSFPPNTYTNRAASGPRGEIRLSRPPPEGVILPVRLYCLTSSLI